MMTIKQLEVTVGEITSGYINNEEQGVRGYGGLLDIRPPYQREFIYNEKEQIAVIYTVLKGYPLNVMYWVKRSEDAECPYEVMDGQQRTLSLCEYVAGTFAIDFKSPSCVETDANDAIRFHLPLDLPDIRQLRIGALETKTLPTAGLGQSRIAKNLALIRTHAIPKQSRKRHLPAPSNSTRARHTDRPSNRQHRRRSASAAVDQAQSYAPPALCLCPSCDTFRSVRAMCGRSPKLHFTTFANRDESAPFCGSGVAKD